MTVIESVIEQVKSQFIGDKFNQKEILDYKKAQKLAYIATQFTATQLVEGMTEKEAAKIMEDFLIEQGVEHFFHHSFVWFGVRSRFNNFSRLPLYGGLQQTIDSLSKVVNFGLPHFGKQFLPSNKKLEKNTVVILDVAPVVNGCAADVAYTYIFGNRPDASQALKDLEPYRDLILEMVKKEKYLSEIYTAVDDLLKQQGYESAHKVYPGEVLGHKIGKLPFLELPSLNILGFDAQSLTYLVGENIRAQFNDFVTKGLGIFNNFGSTQKSPLWGPVSNYVATPGLWAVEPHIAKSDFGVKWEEILVVTQNNAYWLDDDLPHVNSWQEGQSQKFN